MPEQRASVLLCLSIRLVTVAAVFLGVAVIKTAVECVLYSIPVAVKFTKNFIAFSMDAIVMCIGLYVASAIEHRWGER